jgi:hypothetical protein
MIWISKEDFKSKKIPCTTSYTKTYNEELKHDGYFIHSVPPSLEEILKDPLLNDTTINQVKQKGR